MFSRRDVSRLHAATASYKSFSVISECGAPLIHSGKLPRLFNLNGATYYFIHKRAASDTAACRGVST